MKIDYEFRQLGLWDIYYRLLFYSHNRSTQGEFVCGLLLTEAVSLYAILSRGSPVMGQYFLNKLDKIIHMSSINFYDYAQKL